jgi:hypothetical protein
MSCDTHYCADSVFACPFPSYLFLPTTEKVVFSVFQEFVFKLAEVDAFLDSGHHHHHYRRSEQLSCTLQLIRDKVYAERERFMACLSALGAFVNSMCVVGLFSDSSST